MAEQKACVSGVHFSFLPPNAPLTWLATTHHQTARPPSPSLPSAHWAHLAVVHSAAVTLQGSILDGGGRRETDGTWFWYFSADCFHSPLSKNNTHFKTLSELGENKILIIKIFIFGTNVLQEERLQFSCTRSSLLPLLRTWEWGYTRLCSSISTVFTEDTYQQHLRSSGVPCPRQVWEN